MRHNLPLALKKPIVVECDALSKLQTACCHCRVPENEPKHAETSHLQVQTTANAHTFTCIKLQGLEAPTTDSRLERALQKKWF